MATCVKLKVDNGDLNSSLRNFYRAVIDSQMVDQILVPLRLPSGTMVMPTLVDDPEMLTTAEPLAPAFPLNSARLVCRLTRTDPGGNIAVVLRPCEIRAFIELVKLKQGNFDHILIIGMDCLGAFQNTEYLRFAAENAPDSSARFYEEILAGEAGQEPPDGIAPACRYCDQPIADNADISVALWGMDYKNQIMVESSTEKGDRLISSLGLESAQVPETRTKALKSLISKRSELRNEMYALTTEATSGMDRLASYFSACVNCYNCRVACPVCYCRECVFVTDAFDHPPSRYMAWARRKKAVKMPTDTIFYHLTRLAHMSLACVGCGQCSNACPNNIAVYELFSTVAADTQKAFDYLAGGDPDAKPPLTEFRENEFNEIVGLD